MSRLAFVTCDAPSDPFDRRLRVVLRPPVARGARLAQRDHRRPPSVRLARRFDEAEPSLSLLHLYRISRGASYFPRLLLAHADSPAHPQRNVDAALLGFHSLSHLSMTSTQLAITPTFFSTLSHLPLASLVFKGPRNPLLGHVLDWLSSGEQPKELKHLGVDVGVARGERPLWSTWRKEVGLARY